MQPGDLFVFLQHVSCLNSSKDCSCIAHPKLFVPLNGVGLKTARLIRVLPVQLCWSSCCRLERCSS